MDVEIRNETEKDFREVEELTREAFWNLYVPGCNEHYLAHVMRSHPDFVRELDFVAVLGGKIVGNIMYTKARLFDESGRETEILGFGPLSVLPEFQGKGIGSALVRHTVRIAAGMGVKGIVILGDPRNYCRHGFRSGRDYGIGDMNGECPYGLLALELQEGAFAGHAWKFKYSDVYDVDEAAAAAFDEGFPVKEKARRHTQDVFSIAIRAYVR